MVLTANGSSRGSGGLPIYAPNTVRPSQAAVVNIKQAETQQLDIVLPDKATLHRIEGHVEVEGVGPLENALVRLYPTAEGGLTATSSPLSAQKSFSFSDVPDGDYTVEVEFPPTSTLVSVDSANGLIHMRMSPPDYAAASQDIHVAGRDVTDILLAPTHR